MNKSLLTAIAAAMIASSGTVVLAQSSTTTTTTTWTNDQGTVFREYSTTKKYEPFSDPKIEVRVGAELPQSVTVYDRPPTIKVPEPTRYSYSIVNEHPVVVERTTRRIVRTW